MTLTRAEVRERLDAAGLTPRRALGQNFLVDPNLARRIARECEVGTGDPVVEVGAGLGSLTLALAETGARIRAIEVDARLAEVLVRAVSPLGVEVVLADALRVDWAVATPGEGPWVLAGNLPYNVATPLILSVLEQAPAVDRLVVMVQAEVGERLLAGPGSGAAYGAVSVRVAYWATGEIITRVPPAVFLPRPRVGSALVRLRRRPALPIGPDVPYATLCAVVRAGFAHRRKMLRSALAGLVDPTGLEACGVRPEARAEELDLDAWGRIAGWVSAHSGEGAA